MFSRFLQLGVHYTCCFFGRRARRACKNTIGSLLLLQLQTWEFATKYLESAMKCSQRPCISLQNIQRVRIAVEVLFTIVVLFGFTFYLVMYEEEFKHSWWLWDKIWWLWPYQPVIRTVMAFWVLMVLSSSTINVSSLVMLRQQIRRLRESGTNI